MKEEVEMKVIREEVKMRIVKEKVVKDELEVVMEYFEGGDLLIGYGGGDGGGGYRGGERGDNDVCVEAGVEI